MCEENVEFVHVKPGGTYSNHWAFKGWNFLFSTLSLTSRMRPTGWETLY